MSGSAGIVIVRARSFETEVSQDEASVGFVKLSHFRKSEKLTGKRVLSMTRLRHAVTAAILATSFAFVVEAYSLAAQTSPYYEPNAKACKLMPTSDLEARFGGKVTNPHGFDGDSSVCTANIGGLAIKLQSAPAGTAGVPTSVQQGLMGARLMLGDARQSPETNTRDYGRVGCLNMKMTKGFDRKPLAKPLLTTSCFLVEGGYLNVSVAGGNPKQVGFDVIKMLLEKAAERR
jgi:hypothetical protein